MWGLPELNSKYAVLLFTRFTVHAGLLFTRFTVHAVLLFTRFLKLINRVLSFIWKTHQNHLLYTKISDNTSE